MARSSPHSAACASIRDRARLAVRIQCGKLAGVSAGGPLEDTITVYIGIALGVVCALAIAARTLFWFRAKPRSDTPLLDSMIGQQQSRRPAPRQRREPAPQLAMLERQLRNAILDGSARERLVKHAMRTNGGNRATGIRQVLRDLEDENKRWC